MRCCARVRIALVSVLVAGVIGYVLPASAPAAAAPARAFFGLQAGLPNVDDIDVMERGRVGTLRAVFDAGLEASRDPARWEPYDALMGAAGRARISVLPVLIGNAVPRLGLRRPRTRTERAAWGRFVSSIVTRYGRGGTFWAARPELEPIPITAYQVWNEPNLPGYWRPTDDAAGYLRLVRLTRARVLAVDPQAMIVLAGLPDSRHGTRMLDYVRAIYGQPGSRSLFDVVALNPYAPDAPGVLAKLNAVRAYMDRRGDRRTPIWVTEIGWATGGPQGPFRTSRRGQAARIDRTFRALIAARGRLRLTRLIVFALQDRAYGPSERPWWGARTGLFDLAGRPKPAWRTFVRFTGGRPGGRLRSVARP
jgi:hypothetical protein